jgi:metal-sulfur cluster biosynthetic enzyme
MRRGCGCDCDLGLHIDIELMGLYYGVDVKKRGRRDEVSGWKTYDGCRCIAV